MKLSIIQWDAMHPPPPPHNTHCHPTHTLIWYAPTRMIPFYISAWTITLDAIPRPRKSTNHIWLEAISGVRWTSDVISIHIISWISLVISHDDIQPHPHPHPHPRKCTDHTSRDAKKLDECNIMRFNYDEISVHICSNHVVKLPGSLLMQDPSSFHFGVVYLIPSTMFPVWINRGERQWIIMISTCQIWFRLCN